MFIIFICQFLCFLCAGCFFIGFYIGSSTTNKSSSQGKQSSIEIYPYSGRKNQKTPKMETVLFINSND